MLKIQIRDIDELNRLTAELLTLNYLQGLAYYDKLEGEFLKKEIKINWEFVFHYIFDLQCKTSAQLNNLIQKEDFAIPI